MHYILIFLVIYGGERHIGNDGVFQAQNPPFSWVTCTNSLLAIVLFHRWISIENGRVALGPFMAFSSVLHPCWLSVIWNWPTKC